MNKLDLELEAGLVLKIRSHEGEMILDIPSRFGQGPVLQLNEENTKKFTDFLKPEMSHEDIVVVEVQKALVAWVTKEKTPDQAMQQIEAAIIDMCDKQEAEELEQS